MNQKEQARSSKAKIPPVGVVKAVNKLRGRFSKLHQKMVPPHVALLEMVTGMWVAQAVGVVAELGVADHIPAEGESAEKLAKKTGAHAEALYRVLRALSTVGIFVEGEERTFTLTGIGQCLRTDHPNSMRDMAIFQTKVNWLSWGELRHSVRTGKCAMEKVFGEKPFEHLKKHPEKAEIFDKAMVNISRMSMEAVLAAYDFSPFGTIADVGGGYGAFLAAVLAQNPEANGILFDLPQVASGAKKFLAAEKLQKRVQLKSGSFFDSAPAGADAYVLKHILHDWSDEEALQILSNIRDRIPEEGKLLVLEAVISPRNEAHFSKFLDLEMLVVTTGRERSREEFEILLRAAGFKLDRIVPTVSMICVLECSPI